MRNLEKQKERINKRNAQIRKEYWRMYDEKENGVKKYTTKYIVFKISQRYHLSEITIETIITKNK